MTGTTETGVFMMGIFLHNGVTLPVFQKVEKTL